MAKPSQLPVADSSANRIAMGTPWSSGERRLGPPGRIEDYLWSLGFALLVFVLALASLGTLALAARGALSGWLVFPALVAAGVGAAWTLRGTGLSLGRKTLHAIGIGLVVAATLTLALLLEAQIYDLSFDGRWYHQRAVELLATGWDPFRDVLAPQASNSRIQITHYAKALWVAEAALYRLTGQIESVKAVGGLLLVAAVATSCAAFLRLPGLPRHARWILGPLAGLGPIALIQLPTTMVDGAVASLWTCAAAATVAGVAGESRKGPVATMGAVCCLLPVVKFSGLAAVGFLLLPLFVFSLWKDRSRARRMLVTGALAAALSVPLLGFNPYVTNWIHHGHPLAPVTLGGMDAFVARFGPENLRSLPPVATNVVSVFARSAQGLPTDTVRMKLPFTVHRSEIRAFRDPGDVRLAGLGPLFSGALVLGLLGFFTRPEGGWRGIAVLLGVSLTASAVLAPGGWWTRFIPQLWLVPVLGAALLLGTPHRARRVCGVFVVVLLLANLTLVVVPYSLGLVERDRALESQLAGLAAADGVIVHIPRWSSDRLRLEEAGVRFTEVREVEELPCAKPVNLRGSDDTRYCLGGT